MSTGATGLVEPDWTRFPGWARVTAEQWESVLSGSGRTA